MLSCYALKGLSNDIYRISNSLQFFLHGSADSAISNSRRRFETVYNVSTRSAPQMPSIAYTHYASALRVTEFSNAIDIHCTCTGGARPLFARARAPVCPSLATFSFFPGT